MTDLHFIGRSLLAGVEARFSVACRIEERHHDVRTENLTVVICRSRDRSVEQYFIETMESLASTLGPNPRVVWFLRFDMF
jgi:hypothetical protein